MADPNFGQWYYHAYHHGHFGATTKPLKSMMENRDYLSISGLDGSADQGKTYKTMTIPFFELSSPLLK